MKTFGEINEDDVTTWFNKQTPLGLLVKIVLVVVVLSVLSNLLAFGGSWFGAGKDIVSPTNVKEQYAQIYNDYESLKASAGNVCSLRAAVKNASNEDERTQRTSELLASEQNYRRIAAEYDARWDNVFQAKIVGPHDTPTKAPSLEEMIAEVC